MRHPLSTPGSGGVSEGSVAVGDVHGFVVEHALGQAVPQDFQPALAQGPQGGVFERVAGPVADRSTRGAWLRGWRLLGIDGFEVDVADTPGNAEEFGYAGSGDNRSAFPKARVVALAECGTHAFVAAALGSYSVGEKTLANGLYQRLRPEELLTADRNFYSYDAWGWPRGRGRRCCGGPPPGWACRS